MRVYPAPKPCTSPLDACDAPGHKRPAMQPTIQLAIRINASTVRPATTPTTTTRLSLLILLLRWRYLWIRKSVKPRQTERGNGRGGETKKREISCTSLSINLHFWVHSDDDSLDSECGSENNYENERRDGWTCRVVTDWPGLCLSHLSLLRTRVFETKSSSERNLLIGR